MTERAPGRAGVPWRGLRDPRSNKAAQAVFPFVKGLREVLVNRNAAGRGFQAPPAAPEATRALGSD